MTDLVERLLAAIAETDKDLRRNAYHPDFWTVDELHAWSEHPAYEYEETTGDFDDEAPRPDGEGWELNATPARSTDEWTETDPSTGRRTHVGLDSGGPYYSLAYWRRLRPENDREWKPGAKTAAGLRLCQAHREIIDEYVRVAGLREALAEKVRDGRRLTDLETEHVPLYDMFLTGISFAVRALAGGYGIPEGDSDG